MHPILNLDYGGTPTTGIRENESNIALHVYPNPAKNQLNIETNGAIIQHIDVIDVLGNVTISRATDKSAIDIAFLPAGIYTINVSTNAGMARQQFVKQ
jgi:archaellum component FlaF (FlaF/FlaG flagellin family)